MKKTLKFALPALLLSAGVLAYADGEVTLKDKTTMAWSAFVDALNKPSTVEGDVDKESTVYKSWDSAKNRLATANETLKAKQTAQETADKALQSADWDLNGREASEGVDAIVGAKQAVLNAEATQSEKATALTTAQKTYSDANDEYNKALGDQSEKRDSVSSREKMLAQAQANVAAKEAEIAKPYDDQIAAKQATINANIETNIPNAKKQAQDNKGFMEAWMVASTTPESWLSAAVSNADTFNKAYEKFVAWVDAGHDPEKETYTGDNAIIYIHETTIAPRTKTFEVSYNSSFDGVSGWVKYDVVSYDVNFYAKLDNATSKTKFTVSYDFGANLSEKIAAVDVNYTNYGELISLILQTLQDLETEPGYCIEGALVAPTSPAAAVKTYNQYKSLYEEYTTLADTTYPEQNETLQGEIEQLTTDKDNALSADTANESLKTLRKTASDIDDILKEFQQELADDTKIVNKYRATTYKDSEENEKNYIGADGKVVSYLNYLSYQQTVAQNEKTAADNAVAAAQKAETAAQNAYNAAKTDASSAANAVETAATEVKNAQSAFDSAQIAYDAAKKEADAAATAAAQEKYNEITLAPGSVIDAKEPIIKAYGGTIKANGAIFNVNIKATETNTQTALFNEFSGKLDDAAINGSFANNLYGAQFTDVVRWDGNGRIYSENGTPTNFMSNTLADAFGAFGYALRDNEYFGVDFNGREIVKANEAPSKVFSLTAYDVPAGNGDTKPQTAQKYVQLSANGSTDMVTFVNNVKEGYAVPENRFAQSATADVAGLGLTNVYYGDDDFTCDNVKIVDRNSFYCPVTVQAKQIDYGRLFKEGYNSVCLPFQISKDNLPESVLSICEYESVDFDKKKFWFKQNASTVAANTPVLIVLEEGAEKVAFNIENVVIAATDKSQIVSAKAMNDNSQSFGTLRKAHVSEFAGMQYKDYIYGLNTAGQFIAAASDATFPAFRMVIGTNKAINPGNSGNSSNAPKYAPENADYSVMGIGIHDERGYDITDELIATGITTVTEDTPAFEIIGGTGEIMFNSERNFGKVQIFTIDGRLAATANVVEGQSSVSVAHGLYIVMGQKVLVK